MIWSQFGWRAPLVGFFLIAESAVAATITEEDYLAAAALVEGNAGALIKNASIRPNWLADGSGFWYQRSGESGLEFITVTLPGALKQPSFDHAAVDAALSSSLGEGVGLADVQNPALDDALATLTASYDSKFVSCELIGSVSCSAQEPIARAADQLVSPDGRFAAQSRDHNLHLIDLENGEERALAEDGAAYFAYGKMPDLGLMTVQIKKNGLKFRRLPLSFRLTAVF